MAWQPYTHAPQIRQMLVGKSDNWQAMVHCVRSECSSSAFSPHRPLPQSLCPRHGLLTANLHQTGLDNPHVLHRFLGGGVGDVWGSWGRPSELQLEKHIANIFADPPHGRDPLRRALSHHHIPPNHGCEPLLKITDMVSKQAGAEVASAHLQMLSAKQGL